MKTSPLKRYKTPGYPVQDVLAAHPELLKWIPRRWANKPLVISALSLACMILAGRSGLPEDAQTNPAVPAESANARVAPIFHHGYGRGSFGCVSTAAPLFLTEDEARQVIMEEAATAGIHFENTGSVVRQIERPVTHEYNGLARDARTLKPKTRRSALELDGTDVRRKISYEFVSSEDSDAWEIEEYTLMSSVSSMNLESAAEVLQKGLAEAKSEQTLAVFYDPLTSYNFGRDGSKNESEARQTSLRELREQVRDFIAWLKAEGII